MTLPSDPPPGDRLWLGLDTGGTYTDAVVLEPTGRVLATAKVLTTRADLAIGLGGVIEAVVAALPAGRTVGDIGLVSVSTTLATNAVVENRRAPVCVILIGYEKRMLERGGLREVLGDNPLVMVEGGHRATGEEERTLDLDAVRDAVLAHAGAVEAFAVSSLFSVRNPAHEIRVRTLVRELTDKSVTCGHELTSQLDAVRRAVTVGLNAQLTPQLRHLTDAVGSVLEAQGIRAPLMVVKGDGSLMSVAVAVECPVETILSGPAASVVGARFLTGMQDFVISDMGGTTTDIAIVRDGRPVLNDEGATVGGWNTMVQAIDVHTFGLGGDSEIAPGEDGELSAGPRRVVPLSLLAATHSGITETLRRQRDQEAPPLHPARFAWRLSETPALRGRVEERLWAALGKEPLALDQVLRSSPVAERSLTALVGRGLVGLSGFTPSDAMHILDKQAGWNREAACLGAELMLRQLRLWLPVADDAEILDFARRVREQVIRDAGSALCETSFAHDPGAASGNWGGLGKHLIERLVSGLPFSSVLGLRPHLELPLVAVGAPVGGYYSQVAERLGARLVIPDHAEVSNAIGAVAGVVMQSVEIVITAPKQDRFRLHTATGTQDFDDEAEAIAEAEILSRAQALEAAIRAGAADPSVHTAVSKKSVERPGIAGLLVEARIVSTATGRPMAA